MSKSIYTILKTGILLLIGCLCSSCVYLDIAMLDTAEPLAKGKPEFQVYYAKGIDLDSAVFIRGVNVDENDDWTEFGNAVGGNVTGGKVALGIGMDSEIGLKGWEGEGSGVKASFKKRFYHNKGLSVAINPAFFHLKNNDGDDRVVNGLEIPVLATFRPVSFVALTLQTHYNFDMYSRYLESTDGITTRQKGPYNIQHAGVIADLNIRAWVLNLYLEMGVERIEAYNGPISYLPMWGTGLGLEF